MRRACSWVVFVVVAVLGASTAAAQSVDITADTREIYAGLPFSLLVEASGFEEAPEPAAPELAIEGCTVLYVGASPRVVRSTSIVNGRRTDRVEVTFVYRYQVTPSKSGTYKIPALEVEQGTVKARSRQRSFSAKSVKRTDKMALRVALPDRPVWLGETFEVSIDWYLGNDPSRPSFGIPLFGAVDWVTVKPAEEATRRRQTVTFTAGKEELELPYSQERTELDGQPFTRLRFRALVTPLKSGTLELDPARVVSALEVGMGRDRFGFPVAKSEIFEAVDKARSLEIKPLPQSGRPASFKNAVGTGFAIDVQASRTVVRVGDPIELTVTVKSDSRLTGMALPEMSVLLDPNHFVVGDDEPVGETSDEGRTKVFRITAQLKSKDVREVPPLELAYFNPKVGAYETARSQPIALQVAGSAMVGAAQVTRSTGVTAGGDVDPKTVSLVGANLALSSPSKTDSKPLAVGSLKPLLIALYALPLLFLGFMIWRRRTAGSRAAHGAHRKRAHAFDKAIAAASSTPATEAAARIAAELRLLKKQRKQIPEGFDNVIAELDAQAYNPRGGGSPLSGGLVERCKEIGASMLSGAVLLLCLVGSVASAEAGDPIDDARATYQQAIEATDADAARQMFGRAAAGFRSEAESAGKPELLVDWGNASLGARELGYAVLAYRRALSLDRANARARTNLAWVRGTLPSWAPKPEDTSALESLFFWHTDWSLARRHLVAAFAFAFAMLLLVPWRRRPVVWSIAGACVALAIASAMLISVVLEPDHRSEAVVVRDAETLRAADSPGAAAALSRPLPAGLEVKVVETRDRWSHIELADGQRGWLPTTAIDFVVPR